MNELEGSDRVFMPPLSAFCMRYGTNLRVLSKRKLCGGYLRFPDIKDERNELKGSDRVLMPPLSTFCMRFATNLGLLSVRNYLKN